MMTPEQQARCEASFGDILTDVRLSFRKAFQAGYAAAIERECPQWRPIEEAPRDYTAVLLLCAKTYTQRVSEGYYNMKNKGWWLSYGKPVEPTHWMPLPPAPEQQEKEATK